MRFFTPDLYRQFNSPDDQEADRANEAWETALKDYQAHLDGIRDSMPFQVRSVAELCLHDAEVLAIYQDAESIFSMPEPSGLGPISVAILSLQHAGKILSLIYLLGDRIREFLPSKNWPFSKARKHLLYDEIDLVRASRGLFVHRALFSDGSILEIPFYSVIPHHIPLPATDGTTISKQSA